MASYRSLLAASATRQLVATSLLARLPMGMAALATLLLVQSGRSGYAVAGFAVGATALCGALASPVVGAAVDRFGQTRILVPFAIAQSAAWITMLCTVVLEAPGWATVGAAGAVGALRPPVVPCVRVLWPAVVPAGVSVERAYALDATLEELVWVTGPLLVGIVGALSPEAPVLLCAACTLAGTLSFAKVPASRSWQRPPGAVRSRGGALESPGLRVLLVSGLMFGVAFGAGEIALPALAEAIGAPAASGPLIALWCLGSLAGGLLFGARNWRAPLTTRYSACLLTFAVTMLPLLFVGSLAAAIPLAVVAGVAQAPALTCQYALVSRLAPAASVTEAFTWVTGAMVAGVGTGAALAGLVVDASGVAAVFGLAIGGATFAALLILAAYGRVEHGVADNRPAAC